jgi:hypothetical protein
MRSGKLLVFVCLAALLTSSSYAADPSYNYQLIAQSGAKIDGITLLGFEHMAMNDFDSVVFEASYNDGSYEGAAGIFTKKHVLLKKGDVVRGLTVNRPFIRGINDFNELLVSFSYGIGIPTALGKFVLHDDKIVPEGKFLKIGDVIDGLTITAFRETYLTDLGEIFFSANYTDPSGVSSIGVFNRGHVLIKNGSVVDGVQLGQTYSFNTLYGVSDNGTLAFDTYGYMPPQAGSLYGEDLYGAFTQHKILGISGETLHGKVLAGAFSPVISHFGRLAFTAQYDITPNCISYGCATYAAIDQHGTVAKTGDTIEGNFLRGSVSAVAINDQGVVVMQADTGTGYGLFTKDAAVAVTGDKIAGVQVEGFFSTQLNQFGDVGFSAFEAIIVAKHKEFCKRK